jgi:hypothetical protein
MHHLGIELKKAKALSAQAVLEARLGVHLHLQQNDRLLSCAGLAISGPEGPIEAMVPLLVQVPQSGRAHRQAHQAPGMELQLQALATTMRSDQARFERAHKTSYLFSRLTFQYTKPQLSHFTVRLY